VYVPPAFVLDTGVIVAAMRSQAGASRLLLGAALERRFTLLLSVPLFLEYEAVLSRPEQLAACGINRTEAGQVLDDLAAVAKAVPVLFRTRPLLPDPADEMVLEAAVNGGADALVTFNARDFRPAGREYGCQVLSPIQALRRLRS